MTRARIGFVLLFLSTLLVDRGRLLQSDDDLDSARNAAVDANTAIVPTMSPNGVAIGDTPGAFTVTDDGQASYSVPIWTPEGPMGVGPSLALEYNSSAGSGPLGVGWKLSGMPIADHPLPQDGCRRHDAAPIDLVAGNTYCLDGKRLINVGGVGNAEYRTEQDDFTKVVRDGHRDAPQRFRVYFKSGLVSTYGSSTASRHRPSQANDLQEFVECLRLSPNVRGRRRDRCDDGLGGGSSEGPGRLDPRRREQRHRQLYDHQLHDPLGRREIAVRHSRRFHLQGDVDLQIDYGFGAAGGTPNPLAGYGSRGAGRAEHAPTRVTRSSADCLSRRSGSSRRSTSRDRTPRQGRSYGVTGSLTNPGCSAIARV